MLHPPNAPALDLISWRWLEVAAPDVAIDVQQDVDRLREAAAVSFARFFLRCPLKAEARALDARRFHENPRFFVGAEESFAALRRDHL